MPLFDTHTHIYLSQEKTELQILQDIEKTKSVNYITSIGIDIPSSRHNIKLAQQYDFVQATIGIHPCHVEEYKDTKEQTLQELEKMITNASGEIKAIGECGLDYYWLPPRLTESHLDTQTLKELQKYFFTQQIKLAQKYSLPIVIHNREAKDDVFEILKQTDCKNFVFHCYSEDVEFAKKVLNFAPTSFISFSGIVTFNSAKNIQQTAKEIPLKNILIETDCPYLAPIPERGTENHPEKVKFVLKKIQELRDESPEKIEDTIYQNSLRFFECYRKFSFGVF